MVSNHFSITLPTLPQHEREALACVFPLEIFHAGEQDLIVCALENQDGEDFFVQACLDLMECHLEYFDCEDRKSVYARMLHERSSFNRITLALLGYYEMYTELLRTLIGRGEIRFVRVISYRLNQGICVELTYDPLARAAYC